MSSLIEKIKSGHLWDFPGGIHPPGRKSLSNQNQIESISLPDFFIVPIKQHIGQDAKITVTIGDTVKKGQALTESQNHMTLAIHAPSSGTVTDILEHPVPHPSGLSETCIKIVPDGQDEWIDLTPCDDYSNLSKAELLDKIQQAGIAGLGGAAFPTYIKQANSQPIEILIINGVECEPYITSDDTLMRDYSAEIVAGCEIFAHLLKPDVTVIAIEDNKPEAIAAMELACYGKRNFVVRAVPTKYPAGGEKQLIQVITGKEVPSKGIAADIGIMCQNVGTAYAAYRAVVHGEPLTERVVTITGEQVEQPTNVWAKLGTPVSHLLKHAGYQSQKNPRVIMGGPMMGFTLPSDDIPVTKITNCILAPSDKALPEYNNEQACIRCSACADACPASLLPQQLYWHAKAKEYEKAEAYRLFDCIECGACAYVCPSEIPLVQYYRVAKADIKAERAEHLKAEKAKERFEARNQRLERDKQARLEKHRLATEQRKQAMASNTADKDKVAAALARIQAQKAKAKTDASSDVNLDTSSDADSSSGSSADSKANSISSEQFEKNSAQAATKTAAQAAIERVKAKKRAAQAAKENATQSPQDQTSTTNVKSKPAVEDTQSESDTGTKESTKTSADSKTDNTADNKTDDTTGNKNDKPAESPAKQKAKAAIARAKAKKLAAQQAKVDPNVDNITTKAPDQKSETALDGSADNFAGNFADNLTDNTTNKTADKTAEKSVDRALDKAASKNTKADNDSAKLDRQTKIKATIAKAKAKRQQMEQNK